MVQVRRVSSTRASWGINLAFDCHYIRDFRPSSSCMTVTVGNSRAAQIGSKDRWGRYVHSLSHIFTYKRHL